jgi:hypothetical protein
MAPDSFSSVVTGLLLCNPMAACVNDETREKHFDAVCLY